MRLFLKLFYMFLSNNKNKYKLRSYSVLLQLEIKNLQINCYRSPLHENDHRAAITLRNKSIDTKRHINNFKNLKKLVKTPNFQKILKNILW